MHYHRATIYKKETGSTVSKISIVLERRKNAQLLPGPQYRLFVCLFSWKAFWILGFAPQRLTQHLLALVLRGKGRVEINHISLCRYSVFSFPNFFWGGGAIEEEVRVKQTGWYVFDPLHGR